MQLLLAKLLDELVYLYWLLNVSLFYKTLLTLFMQTLPIDGLSIKLLYLMYTFINHTLTS